MKLWELDSILQGDRILPVMVAKTVEDWSSLECFFNDMEKLRTLGRWDILNTILPTDFVKLVLEKSGLVCYKYSDGTIRSHNKSAFKTVGFEVTPVVDVYMQYGGEVLERIFERGIVGDISDDLKIKNILKAENKGV